MGSRDAARASDFAQRFGIERSHGSYAALLADPGIDAVYIATPMSEHHANTLLAIEAGVPTLLEKAFTRTAAEARDVRDRSRSAGVFVMEAMKTRYLPHRQMIDTLIADGVLGEIDSVTAQYGFPIPYQAGSRLFEPSLGGGVLLDIGVYPLSFAAGLLGEIAEVRGFGTLTVSGVEDTVSAVLITPTGARGVIDTTWRGVGSGRVGITGSLAQIDVDAVFNNPAPMSLVSADGRQRLGFDDQRHPGRDGMVFQVAAMARYLRAGLTESPLLGLDESVRVMELLDELRHQVGARFADEREGSRAEVSDIL
ncbi:Gfo/Idh/MocA family oxidoreductase [Salinibacterium sp. ZJ454]|uniref:Gfo/Idh/MocA family protein n=1 Tax=Salinibacterium sp. ZJ454 TaxID=2708339 RepID=UPI0014219EA2|nr:Gfo/Idh/MocA family oxidoreductase [Salinibacterium sp. ZJ454]